MEKKEGNRFGEKGYRKKRFWEESVFARTDFGKIDLARNIFVGFDNFFIEENVEKKSKRNVK